MGDGSTTSFATIKMVMGDADADGARLLTILRQHRRSLDGRTTAAPPDKPLRFMALAVEPTYHSNICSPHLVNRQNAARVGVCLACWGDSSNPTLGFPRFQLLRRRILQDALASRSSCQTSGCRACMIDGTKAFLHPTVGAAPIGDPWGPWI